MRKLILASLSALALFGISGCSDTDETTTQSTQPAAGQQQTGAPEISGSAAAQTTETIQNRPTSGTGGDAPGGATGD